MATISEVLQLLAPKKRQFARAWGGYMMTWLPLAASAANVQGQLTTQDDSDFIIMRMRAYVTSDAAPPVENATPQMTMTLQIGTTDFFPVNAAMHLQQLAVSSGDRRGFELEYPVYVSAQTTLIAKLTNLAATAYNVRLAFWGIRIFNRPPGKGDLG